MQRKQAVCQTICRFNLHLNILDNWNWQKPDAEKSPALIVGKNTVSMDFGEKR